MKREIINRPNQRLAASRAEVERLVYNEEVPTIVKESLSGKLFYIKTFGCQANIRDEEIMAGFLAKAGMERTFEPELANLAIINTCAVRENAEDKIYGEIGSFKHNSLDKEDFILIIGGCVMGEEGVAEKLSLTYPWVSIFMGTHEVPLLLTLIEEHLVSKRQILNVRSAHGEVVENLPSKRLSSFQAYVNISYGCDKFCTYCIVPYTRGRERSRKKEDIIAEVKELEREGYKEVTLLGQNVNSYGLDLKDGTTFASLLDEVAALDIPRLKFLTSYPSQFTDEVIEVMARHKNIEPWLHLPVQSGSTSCLRRMGRRYSREEYLELVRKIKARIPNISLTTDIIVGFPNETEEEFLDTLSLAEEVGYTAAFTFIYSPRPLTPAAKMEQVPAPIAHERFNRLKETIERLTAKHSSSLIGKIEEVLVIGPSKKNEEVLSGYLTNGKLVNFKGPKELVGTLANVRIVESKVYSLVGELAEDPILVKAKDVAFLMRKDPILKRFLELEKAIANDGKLQESLTSLPHKKKDLAMSIAEKEKHELLRKEYEETLSFINDHPLVNNRETLIAEVEAILSKIGEFLK